MEIYGMGMPIPYGGPGEELGEFGGTDISVACSGCLGNTPPTRVIPNEVRDLCQGHFIS